MPPPVPPGKTPIGSVYKQPEMVRALAEHGADIDRIQPGGVPAVVELKSRRLRARAAS